MRGIERTTCFPDDFDRADSVVRLVARAGQGAGILDAWAPPIFAHLQIRTGTHWHAARAVRAGTASLWVAALGDPGRLLAAAGAGRRERSRTGPWGSNLSFRAGFPIRAEERSSFAAPTAPGRAPIVLLVGIAPGLIIQHQWRGRVSG